MRTPIYKFNTIHTQNRLIKHEINTDPSCLVNALSPWLCFSYGALLSRNFIIVVFVFVFICVHLIQVRACCPLDIEHIISIHNTSNTKLVVVHN